MRPGSGTIGAQRPTPFGAPPILSTSGILRPSTHIWSDESFLHACAIFALGCESARWKKDVVCLDRENEQQKGYDLQRRRVPQTEVRFSFVVKTPRIFVTGLIDNLIIRRRQARWDFSKNEIPFEIEIIGDSMFPDPGNTQPPLPKRLVFFFVFVVVVSKNIGNQWGRFSDIRFSWRFLSLDPDVSNQNSLKPPRYP